MDIAGDPRQRQTRLDRTLRCHGISTGRALGLNNLPRFHSSTHRVRSMICDSVAVGTPVTRKPVGVSGPLRGRRPDEAGDARIPSGPEAATLPHPRGRIYGCNILPVTKTFPCIARRTIYDPVFLVFLKALTPFGVYVDRRDEFIFPVGRDATRRQTQWQDRAKAVDDSKFHQTGHVESAQ